MLLSVVIPAYNEEKTIILVLKQIKNLSLPKDWKKEVIVINDCSEDKTRQLLEEYKKNEDLEMVLINNEVNLGKTQSIKKGLQITHGDFVIIQDADSEYEVENISEMLNKALREKLDVVYGDRFSGNNGMLYKSFYFGNRVVSFFSDLFTYPRMRVHISDMEVCYKLVKGNIIRNIAPCIEAKSSFGLEPEITARLSRYKIEGKHLKLGITPIKYYPRTIEEGKKIRYSDGIKAIKEIIRYNLF